MAIKLNELKNMTAREVSHMGHAGIREAYQTLKKITGSRISTFKKHGAGEAVPDWLHSGLQSSRGRTDAELVQDMRKALGWIRGKRSTYKGYEQTQEDFRQKMQESMPDLDLSDEDKMKDFGNYMGEMQERYGEMWHAISNTVRDIYRDLTRLNKDPKQFMSNYDYWVNEMERINAEKAAQHIGGRRRSTTLSTYMRQLKRGKIK